MVKYVTEEEKNTANNIDLVQYLLSIGEPIKSEGSHFYRHMQHDSLVVNTRRNYFSWNSKNISGNAVTYLMNVHDMSFQNAVKKINADLINEPIEKYTPKEPEYPKIFNYDVKESNSHENILNYLVGDRKIDSELVDLLIREDYIKEDTYKNVVFKWKEKGQLIGASQQGTREIPIEKRLREDRAYFKKVLPTTKEATDSGFNITRGYPEKLYFFESPIDALSYFSLNKNLLNNCRLQCMDGLKEVTIFQTVKQVRNELLKYGRDIKELNLCVDNDKAGNDFIKKLKEAKYIRADGQYVDMVGNVPGLPEGETKWDWNNELQSHVNKSLKKNIAISSELDF
ncbi:hypothetical protein BTS2_3341 [Bacillus sp. TS-2]|nr:hypothetical protein BTS2_3341 [Bacillus sp. TS-2]